MFIEIVAALSLLGPRGVSAPVAPPAKQEVTPDAAFPASSPEEQGIDPQALELLSEEVEHLLAQDALVGAELHVIQNRHTVLHRAYGFADRDEDRPMSVNSVFCIRSMTKPFVGTAIQMLLDEGRLTLDTRAAEILPAYDTPDKHDITIEHLLTHTSGLPFTTIGRPLDQYADLGEVAAEAATVELLFRPGTRFQYSDAGSDTLGAIVARVTGAPVEDFVQTRLLDPLSMHDTTPLLEPGSPVFARIPSAYSGNPGAWMRHWVAADAVPLFPLFLTSQGLYSTTGDYARFLALWMDGGRDLLSPAAIRRGLTARERLPAPCGFAGVEMFYGQQWMVYAAADDRERVVLFGHNGSDGTHAWGWPDRDLMVLFFTQTRGTMAGLSLEAVLDRLLIRGDLDGHRRQVAERATASTHFAACEGLYWDQTNRRAYYVVKADGERLTMERPGGFVLGLSPTETPGHFTLDGEPSVSLEFEEPQDGASQAFLMRAPGGTERQVRHHAAADCPDVETVLDHLHRGHGLDAQDDVGVIQMKGKILVRGMEGRVEATFDARRSRYVAKIAGSSERVWVTGDDRVFQQINGREVIELEGPQREQEVLGHPLRRLQGWQDDYAMVEVLCRLQDDRSEQVRDLVRTVSREGAGATRMVDPDTGHLVGEDRFIFLPGAGRIGLQVTYGDFRDVGGLSLPFRVRYKYAYAPLGEMEVVFEEAEVGVEEGELLVPPVGE